MNKRKHIIRNLVTAVLLGTTIFLGAGTSASAETTYTVQLREKGNFTSLNDYLIGSGITPDMLPALATQDPSFAYVHVGGDGAMYLDSRAGYLIASYPAGTAPVIGVQGNGKDIRYSGLRKKLDAIPLYPMQTTGYAELDQLLDAIFAQIITPDMDTHDKMKACYDYLIANTVYGINSGVFGGIYDSAYATLTEGVGVCDNYTDAFIVMCHKIGVPIYHAGGGTTMASGGYTAHSWAVLQVGDEFLVFDPQVEDNITTKKGSNLYLRFGGNMYTQLKSKYLLDELYD